MVNEIKHNISLRTHNWCTKIKFHVKNIGLLVGIGVGFLHHLHITNDFIIDIICADYVVNTSLAAIWLCAEKHKKLQRIPDPEVFHVTSKGYYLTSGKNLCESKIVKEKRNHIFIVLIINID